MKEQIRVSLQKQIFDVAASIGERYTPPTFIMKMAISTEEQYKIYINKTCIQLSRRYKCKPKDFKKYPGVERDGYLYQYWQPAGFTPMTLEKAFQLLKKLRDGETK